MRHAILILAVLGSFLGLLIGGCYGLGMASCAQTANDLGAVNTAEETYQESGIILLSTLLQFIFGLAGGIMAFTKLGASEKATIGGALLGVSVLLSVVTESAEIAGVLNLIALALAFTAKPDPKEA